MDKRHRQPKNNNKMVQEEQQLRQLFQQIYEARTTKNIPEDQLIEILQKEKGLTKKQAQQLIDKASEHKILRPGLRAKIDYKTGKILKKTIVLEYMTEEDWEIEKALDEIEDEIYQLKKQLHPEEYE